MFVIVMATPRKSPVVYFRATHSSAAIAFLERVKSLNAIRLGPQQCFIYQDESRCNLSERMPQPVRALLSGLCISAVSRVQELASTRYFLSLPLTLFSISYPFIHLTLRM